MKCTRKWCHNETIAPYKTCDRCRATGRRNLTAHRTRLLAAGKKYWKHYYKYKPTPNPSKLIQVLPLTDIVRWDNNTAVVTVISIHGTEEVRMDRDVFESLVEGGYNLSISRCNLKFNGSPVPQVTKKSDGKLVVYYLRRYVMNHPVGFDVVNMNKNTLDCRRSNLALKPNKRIPIW